MDGHYINFISTEGKLKFVQGLLFIHVHSLGKIATVVILQADALVCCVDKTLDLRKAPLSSKIVQRAGPTVQQECVRNKPENYQYGNVVVTGPGKMSNCQALFFGSCMDYGNTNSEKVLV